MKLIIRKGIFSWNVYQESGQFVASIPNKNFLSVSKIICDDQGIFVYHSEIKNERIHHEEVREYLLYKNTKIIASAIIIQACTPTQTMKEAYKYHLTQVKQIDVKTPYGLWHIKKTENNELIVSSGDVQLGSVTAFFSFSVVNFECCDTYDAIFYAAIYCFMNYINHEDDAD